MYGPLVAAPLKAEHRDYSLVLLASLLWGTSFPAIKLAVGGGDVDPFLLTFLRLAIGALLGSAFVAVFRRPARGVLRNPYVWVLGALNAISFDLQHLGEVFTTASKTSLLVNVNVVFIAVLMAVLYRERMTRVKVSGVAFGLVGVAVLATRLDPAFATQGEFRGDVLVLLSGIVWALYTINTKEMLERGGDVIALSVGVLATTALFSLSALPFVDLGRPVPTSGWFGVAWLGLVSTFLPLALWSLALRRISPTVSAILLLMEVVMATVLSIAFLGESFTPLFLVGGTLVLLGVALALRTPETERPYTLPDRDEDTATRP